MAATDRITLEEHFSNTRNKASMGYGIFLTPKGRGWRVGMVNESLQKAARLGSLDFNGETRKARMLLATEVFERPVSSYNDLDEDELIALEQWATTHIPELKEWLEKTFGKQLGLPM